MVVGLDGIIKKDQDSPGVLDVLIGEKFSIFTSDIKHSFTDPVLEAQKNVIRTKYGMGVAENTDSLRTGNTDLQGRTLE